VKRILQRLDRLQKRTRASAVTVATLMKFGEEHSANYAAMIAFWAFFSMIPLLLVLVTTLGWVLPASSKESVLSHVAGLFPLLDAKSVTALSGSVWALIVGLLTALWSGLGVVRTLQYALDSVWDVPAREQPGMLARVGRSLAVLGTIGVGLVLSTLLSGFVTSTANGVNLGTAGRVGGYLVTAVLDVGLIIATFRILTTGDVAMRDLLPGALLAGVVFLILQAASAAIISSHLKNTQSTYGHFATVITILWWFYLQSLLTMVAAQLNVVLRDHLYPRSLVDAPQTEADRRVLRVEASQLSYESENAAAARVERTR
jgi:YihY family inner membrane protein